MGTPVGAQGHLGFRIEYSFASGGAIEHWIPINSEDIQLVQANVYTDRIANSSQQIGGQQGNRAVNGTFEMPVTPQTPLDIWRAVLGQGTSPFYTERPIKSILIEVDKETSAFRASGCSVASASIGSSQGGELTMSITVEGKDLASTTASSPSYTADDNPYLHSEGAFELDESADTSITSWSLNIENNLVTDLYGSNRTRIDIPAGKCAVTGSFTKLFDDVTERNKFIAATEVSFKATFTRGNTSLVFWIPEARYDSRPDPISGQSDYILETFNFTGYVDNPADYALRISGDITI